MRVAQAIRERLERDLAPAAVEVVDQSALHAGHAGARAQGETHFAVAVVSERFAGLSRLARQRLVHGSVGELMGAPIHALSVQARTPAEAAAAARAGRDRAG